MNRRLFLSGLATAGSAGVMPAYPRSTRSLAEIKLRRQGRSGRRADIVVLGGGLGGCSAALAALEMGCRVIMTEETDWIGGQLTAQGVPPDEHRWIESHGCTRRYRQLREAIREYYRRHYPLQESVLKQPQLNPGDGSVSRLCHEPRVALAVLQGILARYQSTQQLQLLLEHKVRSAWVTGDTVRSVACQDLRTGQEVVLEAAWFIDATELGDLLPLAKVEHVTGAESQKTTGEPHAPAVAQPSNQQAFTMCFAVDHVKGEDFRIPKPSAYAFWKDYVPRLTPSWPGKLLSFTYSNPVTLEPRTLPFSPILEDTGTAMNLWKYRRIASAQQFQPGTYAGDISLINWPQNDYWLGNLVGVSDAEAAHHVRRAKELSLSLLYWLQTDAPRLDGGQGWPGLRLRPDLLGTEEGLAKYPYIRESRRIQAVTTITELHCGKQARAQSTGQPEATVKAESYLDSVGIGHYNIDLHPSSHGNNYVDIPSLPFEIPLGALLPVRIKNLLPACKNLGTTHITNGCYRLHPVEWNIGEAAGALAAFVHQKKVSPHSVRERSGLLQEFQKLLRDQGVSYRWMNL